MVGEIDLTAAQQEVLAVALVARGVVSLPSLAAGSEAWSRRWTGEFGILETNSKARLNQ